MKRCLQGKGRLPPPAGLGKLQATPTFGNPIFAPAPSMAAADAAAAAAPSASAVAAAPKAAATTCTSAVLRVPPLRPENDLAGLLDAFNVKAEPDDRHVFASQQNNVTSSTATTPSQPCLVLVVLFLLAGTKPLYAYQLPSFSLLLLSPSDTFVSNEWGTFVLVVGGWVAVLFASLRLLI